MNRIKGKRLLPLVAALVMMSAFPVLWASDDFQTAVWGNDLAAITRLAPEAANIDARGTNGKTALMIAAKSGDFELVGQLLKLGADPNAANINGGTPIMFAAISGEILTIKILIDAGVDVSAQGSNGWGALMVAAAKGHLKATRLILDAGADINTTDVYLWTPLMRAAYENRREVVAELLEHEDIEIHFRDEHGATALHHAANQGHGDIVELLIIHGADPGIQDARGKNGIDVCGGDGACRPCPVPGIGGLIFKHVRRTTRTSRRL